MKVYIDPACNIVYASYYIQGLRQLFGKSRIRFSAAPFRDLIKGNGREDFDHYFAFVADNEGTRTKVAIDFRDKTHLNRSALNWCDVYGKVNFNSQAIKAEDLSPDDHAKIQAVGPNFGVKLWSKPVTGLQFLLNYARSGFSPGVSRAMFFASYKWEFGRAGIEAYAPVKPDDGYVFFISTLWKNDQGSDALNRLRASFIRACKQLCPRFEGGLFAREKAVAPEYRDIVTHDYIHHSLFTDKTRHSLVVFNTPAVWNCHGWKLGEFLAMGKAIISTPFQNEMPEPMTQGVNIHFVNTEEELQEAVRRITTDDAYRSKLEAGAAAYYRAHIQPAVVVEKLLQKAR